MKEINATILTRTSLTHDVVELVLRPEERIHYLGGQYVMLRIPQEHDRFTYRAFSIANHPADKDRGIIRLLIKILPGGTASDYLKERRVKDIITLRGGYGFFTFKSAGAEDVYLVCTGTGIAPLLAMIEEELERGNPSRFHLIFGNRFKVDIFWEDYLEKLAERFSTFHYSLTLSRPVGYWQGNKGYVTDLLKEDRINMTGGHFYLCGHPQMIDDAKRLLKDRGVSPERIFEEKFISVGKSLHANTGLNS